jgi:hypothetical protein
LNGLSLQTLFVALQSLRVGLVAEKASRLQMEDVGRRMDGAPHSEPYREQEGLHGLLLTQQDAQTMLMFANMIWS